MARERRIVGETEISLSALRYPTSFERNKTGVTRARPSLANVNVVCHVSRHRLFFYPRGHPLFVF